MSRNVFNIKYLGFLAILATASDVGEISATFCNIRQCYKPGGLLSTDCKETFLRGRLDILYYKFDYNLQKSKSWELDMGSFRHFRLQIRLQSTEIKILRAWHFSATTNYKVIQTAISRISGTCIAVIFSGLRAALLIKNTVEHSQASIKSSQRRRNWCSPMKTVDFENNSRRAQLIASVFRLSTTNCRNQNF